MKIVRPCPEIPAGLMEALDRNGEAFCPTCGETVLDLAHRAPARVARCARILVVASALASCAPHEVDAPRMPPTAPRADPSDVDVAFKDDPLAFAARYATGAVELAPPAAPLTMEPGR